MIAKRSYDLAPPALPARPPYYSPPRHLAVSSPIVRSAVERIVGKLDTIWYWKGSARDPSEIQPRGNAGSILEIGILWQRGELVRDENMYARVK